MSWQLDIGLSEVAHAYIVGKHFGCSMMDIWNFTKETYCKHGEEIRDAGTCGGERIPQCLLSNIIQENTF